MDFGLRGLVSFLSLFLCSLKDLCPLVRPTQVGLRHDKISDGLCSLGNIYLSDATI